MSYNVHNFEDGQTLYASQLNAMEVQIAKNEASSANDHKRIESNERSLNALWSLNEGVTFSFETDDDDGNKVIPTGAKFVSVNSFGGRCQKVVQLYDKTYTAGTSTSRAPFRKGTKFYASHKYYAWSNGKCELYVRSGSTQIKNHDGYITSTGVIFSMNYDAQSDGTFNSVAGNIYAQFSEVDASEFDMQIFDLTEMGIDSITTVEEFNELLPNSYYNSTNGTIVSNTVDSVMIHGVNLFNPNARHITYGIETGSLSISADGSISFVAASSTESYFGTEVVNYGDHLNIDARARAIDVRSMRAIQAHMYTDYKSKIFVTEFDAKYMSLGFSQMLNHASFTLNNRTCYVSIRYGIENVVSGNTYTVKCAITDPIANITSYVPYKAPISVEISSSIINACPDYGLSAGSVYNYIDFVRKVYVKRVDRVDMGSLSWGYSNDRFQAWMANAKTQSNNLLCERYTTYGSSYSMSTMPDKSVKRGQSGDFTLYVHDEQYSDYTTFKSSLNGVYLNYELETPIEIDVSSLIDDRFDAISVEAGGSIRFVDSSNDLYNIPVPNSVQYIVKLSEVN